VGFWGGLDGLVSRDEVRRVDLGLEFGEEISLDDISPRLQND
jgi:hypothetical protein